MATSISAPAPTTGPLDAAYVFGRCLNQYRWHSTQAAATDCEICEERALHALAILQCCGELVLPEDCGAIQRCLELLACPPYRSPKEAEAEMWLDAWDEIFDSYVVVCDNYHGQSHTQDRAPAIGLIAHRLSEFLSREVDEVHSEITSLLGNSPERLNAFHLGSNVDYGLRPRDFVPSMVCLIQFDKCGEPVRSKVAADCSRLDGPQTSDESHICERMILPREFSDMGVRIRGVHVGALPPSSVWLTRVEWFWNACVPEPFPLVDTLNCNNTSEVEIAISNLDRVARRSFHGLCTSAPPVEDMERLATTMLPSGEVVAETHIDLPGVTLDVKNRTLTRDGVPVDFGKAIVQWPVVLKCWNALPDSVSKGELGQLRTKNDFARSMSQIVGEINLQLSKIGLEIVSPDRGKTRKLTAKL